MQWFIERIGSTLYRTQTECDCESCTNVYKNGVKVSDRDHAIYLFDIECECGYKYFDTKKERDDYENANKDN